MNNSSRLLLSLSPSMRDGLESLAQAEGKSVDHLLVIAIAEKLARSEHAAWLAEQSWLETALTTREKLSATLKEIDTDFAVVRQPIKALGEAPVVLPEDATLQLLNADEERERKRLADLFDGTPVPIAVLSGPEYVYEMVNDAYRVFLGGERDLIGRRVLDCLPELAGTPWMDNLDRVYRTGEPYVEHGARLTLAPYMGRPAEDKFVDYVYKPRRGADGAVNGLIAIGVETSLVKEVFQSTDGAAFLLDDK